jgi:nicotinamidase-related amidase
MLLSADDSVLLVIDIQARLLPAMADPDAILARATLLMRAARRLGVPLLVTEQYRRGLGATVPELAALATVSETVEKIDFACTAEPAVRAQLDLLAPRRQAVLCGIEAHVCVLQSALGLSALGWQVSVVADAVGSRRDGDRNVALARLEAAGITIVTTEMVLFEWLGRAGTDAFKDLLKLIK